MFNTPKDQLFILIKSLSKSEKRAFTLYANRMQSAKGTKFIQLFEVLSKLNTYDEELLLKRLPDIKKQHLANLKRHLYKQILTSLRLIHIQKNIDIQIREQLDFARILYGKGMYMQALRLLDRTKKIANEHHQDLLHLEILEFQKLIEARHITRSRLVQNKMDALLNEAAQRSLVTHSSSLFSNFNIQIHGWYIEHGHVKSEEEVSKVRDFFENHIPREHISSQLAFFEKANLFQAYMWFSYILLDFKGGSIHAQKWVAIFENDPAMKAKDPGLYMRALYYLLVFLYLEKEKEQYQFYLNTFIAFKEQYWEKLNENAQMIGFTYLNLSRLNYYHLSAEYKEGIQVVPIIEKELHQLESVMDLHRILLFYFKFSYLYFCCHQYEKALEYLNEIIHLKTGHLREDLLHNANLLHLICHFELNHYDLLDYLIPSVSRLFDKAKDAGKIPELTLSLLSKLVKSPESEHEFVINTFYQEFQLVAQQPYEQKSIMYLDILSWLESKTKF